MRNSAQRIEFETACQQTNASMPMRTWRPRVQDITKPTETARSKAQKEKSEHPLESSLSDHKIKKTHDAMLETPISKAPPRRRSSVGLNELLSRIDVLQDKASELNKRGDATRARLQLQAAETLAKRLDSVYPPPSFSSLRRSPAWLT